MGGDHSVKDIGVVAEPEVVCWPLKDEKALLLACSDGVWEFLSSGNSAEVIFGAIREGATHQQALDALLREAVKQWHTHEEGTYYVDDISIVMASLTSQEAPRYDDNCVSRVPQSLLYNANVGFYPEGTRGMCEVCAVQ